MNWTSLLYIHWPIAGMGTLSGGQIRTDFRNRRQGAAVPGRGLKTHALYIPPT